MVSALGGIIPILIIIFIISRISSSAKKVQSARPGQHGAAPARGPAGGQPKPGQRTISATPPGPVAGQPLLINLEPAAPAPESAAARDRFYGMLDESDRARSDLAEGDSRECDHGSVGGSMDITSHMGQGDTFEHAKQQVQTSVKVNVRPSRAAAQAETKAAAQAIPEMSAKQMRQAVIMAEILRRPAERFAGRRWAAR